MVRLSLHYTAPSIPLFRRHLYLWIRLQSEQFKQFLTSLLFLSRKWLPILR